MRKFLCLLLSLTILASLTACGSQTPGENGGMNDTTGVGDAAQDNAENAEHTGVKYDQKIAGGSDYSEGLAFVTAHKMDEKTYCIDKNGYIIFEFDEKQAVNGDIYCQFVNGLALVGENIYDKTGKVTTPESVGVTKFYNIAFADGYILAEKVTADYASTKKEFGVMDKNFQWVVALSEALYKELEEDGGLSSLAVRNTDSVCVDGKLYFAESKKCLNLKAGTITEKVDSFPSASWVSDGYTYQDFNGKVMLDLDEYENATFWSEKFVNGKTLITFHNSDANAYYFTLIDEKGNFAFEPVELKDMVPGMMYFDGEVVLVCDSILNNEKLQTYDITGKVLGELNTEYSSATLGDGVVKVVYGAINTSYDICYYNPDFTPLF